VRNLGYREIGIAMFTSTGSEGTVGDLFINFSGGVSQSGTSCYQLIVSQLPGEMMGPLTSAEPGDDVIRSIVRARNVRRFEPKGLLRDPDNARRWLSRGEPDRSRFSKMLEEARKQACARIDAGKAPYEAAATLLNRLARQPMGDSLPLSGRDIRDQGPAVCGEAASAMPSSMRSTAVGRVFLAQAQGVPDIEDTLDALTRNTSVSTDAAEVVPTPDDEKGAGLEQSVHISRSMAATLSRLLTGSNRA